MAAVLLACWPYLAHADEEHCPVLNHSLITDLLEGRHTTDRDLSQWNATTEDGAGEGM